MDRKWKEKNALEKTMDIIAGIALCVWLISELLGRNNKVPNTDFITCAAIFVVCVCQAFSYWKVKRAFSYVAIGGAVLLLAVMVVKVVWAV